MNQDRNTLFIATIFISIIVGFPTCSSKVKTIDDKIVLAYITGWSSIIPDPNCLTHINYAFGQVNETFDRVKISTKDRLRQIAQLKEQYPDLKICLSIGGWRSGGFSEMAANEISRKAFAADCKRIVDEYKIDGIDMDWEYPTSTEAGISALPTIPKILHS